MASGAPVVCSNRTAVPEVAGEAGLLVDPLSISDMAEALSQVMFDESFAAELIMKGDQQARLYHPENVNSKMKNFWEIMLTQR